MASYSSSGPEVDLLAPGSSIISSYKWGSYVSLSGSSMAAAHVSGAAALLRARYPGEGIDVLRRRLLSGAKAQKWPAKSMTGAGITRVDTAIQGEFL
nr:S8 family serine peptidase [Desulforamulus aquiferis]